MTPISGRGSGLAYWGTFPIPTYFARVHVDPEAGTIAWPNRVDLAFERPGAALSALGATLDDLFHGPRIG